MQLADLLKMKDNSFASWACILAVALACQSGTAQGRDFSSAAAQPSSQPAGHGSDASVHQATKPTRQQPPQGSAQAAEHHADRRMMRSEPTGPAALTELNIRVPEVNANKFKKIATTNSRPLGTALNGSAWEPGVCGPHPTALGYQCSWVGAEGAVLHWTYSSHSSSPPINRCTRQPQAVPNLEIQELDGPTVHFALQAVTKEKLHLAFMDPEARLYPSEGVHGRALNPCNKPAECNVTSTPEVEVLHHTSPGVVFSTGRVSSWNSELMQGWAGWVSADTEGQTQVLCFSRHVYTKQMKMGPQNNMELLIQYATSDADNYMGYGQLRGALSLDLLSGKATEIKTPTGVLLAHAALMLIAFGVLLPTGLLLARHKWLFWHEEEGLSPLWALSHFGVLLLCAMVALAGMIVALVRFGNTITGLVMSTHQVLGLLSVGLSVVLAIMYGLRPFLVSSQKHKHMPSPLLGPQKVIGVITIGTGWTSLFLGCVVIHQNWAAPYITWLTPCILMTALVACAAVLLELRYQKLVRTGAYNPKTCTMSNKGPAMPLARIRTHREPIMPKKQEPDVVGEAHRDSPTIAAIHMHGSDGSPAAAVAATMLARSNGIDITSQLPVSTDNSTPRSCMSSAGGRSSSAGGAVRRTTRHSTPNAAAAAVHVVQTGFPNGPRPPMGPADTA